MLFYLSADLLTVAEKVAQAHARDKLLLIHMDLAEGIGKDRTGIRYLASCGVDGIISTKGQLIRQAKEQGLFAVQRFFAVDSSGAESIGEMIRSTNPDIVEIMPGVALKVIKQYAEGKIPVITGGLLQTKTEVTDALGAGAIAVTVGSPKLWYL